MVKLATYLFHFFLIAASPFCRAASASDSEREKFFHEMYSKYNSAPTPRRAWNQMVSQSRVNTYQVQPGDTLWEISNTLFADPQFWPKLWAENSQNILNPHQIESGKKILFYGGSSEAPPYFASQGHEEDVSASLSGDSRERSRKSNKKTPVLDKIPPSFAKLVISTKPIEFPELAPDFGKKRNKDPQSPLSSYVSEINFESIQEKIIDIEKGSQTASLGDIVFVELNEPTQSIYHIVSSSEFKDRKEPQITHVQGQIEILGRASSKKPVYKARITQAIGQISKQHKLLPGPLPYFTATSEGQSTQVPAQIIGGSLPKNQILSVGQIAFIDAGGNQGLKTGDLLQVYLNPNLRVGRDLSDMNYKSIGLLKVIQTVDKYSTVYILDVSDDIRVGDWVGLQDEEESNSERE